MPKTQKAVRLMNRVKLHGQWGWCRLALDPKRQPRRDIVLVIGREHTDKKIPPSLAEGGVK